MMAMIMQDEKCNVDDHEGDEDDDDDDDDDRAILMILSLNSSAVRPSTVQG